MSDSKKDAAIELGDILLNNAVKEIQSLKQQLESTKDSLKREREFTENLMNEIATMCWQKQTDMIDPEDLNIFIDKARETQKLRDKGE